MRVSVLTLTEALVTVDVEPGDVVEVCVCVIFVTGLQRRENTLLSESARRCVPDPLQVLTAKVNALEPSRGGTCLMLYGKALEPGRTLAECGVEDGGLLQQVPAQLEAVAPAPAPAPPAPSAQVLSTGPSAAPEAGGGSGTSASTSSGGSDGGSTATPLVLIGDRCGIFRVHFAKRLASSRCCAASRHPVLHGHMGPLSLCGFFHWHVWQHHRQRGVGGSP